MKGNQKNIENRNSHRKNSNSIDSLCDLNNVTIEELENEVRDLGYDPEEYGKRALDLIAELKRRSF
jgi:hypothetical protein